MADKPPTKRRRRSNKAPTTSLTSTPVPDMVATSSGQQDASEKPDLHTEVQSLKETVAALVNVVQTLLPAPSATPQMSSSVGQSMTATNEALPAAERPMQQAAAPIIAQATLAPSQGIQGESTSHNVSRPLLYSNPVQPGLHLNPKIREKIACGKYVDFYDILYPEAEQAYTMQLSNASAPMLSFTPRKRRQLSPTEWCSAWDDFMAVYLHHHPTELQDLLTYGKRIKLFMSTNQNWRFYDEQFRRDREHVQCSWASLRVDLQITASVQSTASHNSHQSFQPFRRQYAPNQKKGYCFQYNTPNVRCLNTSCTYLHKCTQCNQGHPTYTCKTRAQGAQHQQQNKSGKQPNQAANADKSAASKQAT